MATIPPEKIFSLTATEYCGMAYLPLQCFTPIGLHARVDLAAQEKYDHVLADQFVRNVPKNTEAVVNYQIFISGGTCFLTGTALVRNKDYEKSAH